MNSKWSFNTSMLSRKSSLDRNQTQTKSHNIAGQTEISPKITATQSPSLSFGNNTVALKVKRVINNTGDIKRGLN